MLILNILPFRFKESVLMAAHIGAVTVHEFSVGIEVYRVFNLLICLAVIV